LKIYSNTKNIAHLRGAFRIRASVQLPRLLPRWENLSSWALNPDAIFPAPVKERLPRNLKEFRYQIS
jgi:hypothetical protein